VVRSRRDGRNVYYSIANQKLIQAFDLITEVMQESMEARSRAADTPGA
jgi:DNA-binding transcriptional ArsR family regulator